MLLIGCQSVQSLSLVPNAASVASRPAASSEEPSDKPSAPDPAKNEEEPSKIAKRSSPRTLPQALCVYWNALRSCPCSASAEAQDKDGKTGGDSTRSDDQKKKSPNGNGDTEKKNDQPEDGKADKKNGEEELKETWFSAHGQMTTDTQLHGSFPALYTGPRSLLPNQEAATSMTSTLFLDARLWECGSYTGELVFNPEIAGGKGFSGVNGIAGFTNGDITRVGVPEPTPYFARIFLRQTWGLGGEQEKVEDEPNQIAGKRDIDRITLMAGKFAFTDVIDNNTCSHDPRTQMQNWALMYNGAWDYPANVRGYTYGLAIDLNQKNWALRYGVTAEPAIANGAEIDPHINKALGQALEWEGRWACNEHPGLVRVFTYLNHAHMGDYREALAEMPVNPDVTLTRSYRFKYGFGLNFQQEVSRDLGVWGRFGWSDGHTEAWAFTPIDRSAALGLLLKGRCWARPNDEVGLAGVCNGIARDHRAYLGAGGLDFNLGDGALNYGLEEILEFYYRLSITKEIWVTFDLQGINHPAYNRDRGPVAAESLLVHFDF